MQKHTHVFWSDFTL